MDNDSPGPLPAASDAASPQPRFVRSDAVAAALLPFAAWSLLCILGAGWWPWPMRIAAAAAWIAALVVAVRAVPRRRAWAPILGAVVLVQAAWMLRSPSSSRPWVDVQQRSPAVVVDGDRAVVRNVRNVAWRTADDRDVRWETREYDLSTVASVDFAITTFGEWRGLAHTFLSFGFQDGRHLVASFEVRRERGESYHPASGLFRNYEIACVLADERDAIALRAFVQNDATVLYPLRTDAEARRRLLESVLRRADELGRQPEFYNTVTNNCTTNLVQQCEALTGDDLGLDWRILFPGYSDDLAFDLGFVDTDLPLAAARERFRIGSTPPTATDEAEWSEQLRDAMVSKQAR